MSEKVALCSDYMRVWPIPDGMNPILSALPTVREPQDNSLTFKVAASERASKSSCDTWLKYFIENAEDLCLESLSGFIRKTTLEHNLKGRFFQRNKIFKPAIMGTRFPPRAAADFFLKHYPNAPRHIKYEYGSIDWSGQAIRALQSLTQI